MLCKLQHDRIINNTKIMCLKQDYAFFWRLVYMLHGWEGNTLIAEPSGTGPDGCQV